MKALNLKISKEKKPLHLKIADAVREAIIQGQVLPTEKLPSSRALAHQLGTHRHTVMNGLDELVAEGWVVSMQRKGYVVAANLPLQYIRVAKAPRASGPALPFQWKWTKKMNMAAFQPEQPLKFNFQSGLPDFRLFPRAEFHYHLSQAMKKGKDQLFGYGNPAGVETLTHALDTCLRRIKNIANRKTLVTNGSQEAIYLTLRLLVRPGDHVCVEDPGYPPVRELLRSMGAHVVPIPLDQDGIIPEKLEAVIKKHAIRVLFLTPLHQFPSTVTLSAPRRIQIYEIAHKNKIAIIEDDYDHEFHYKTQPQAPMASQDVYQQIIYVGTLSKLTFPAARLGFMSVPTSFAENFLQYRRLVTHQNEAIVQQALGTWILDGGFERHLNRMRKAYEKRLMALENSLHSMQTEGKNISWHKPTGGMAVWLNVNQNSSLVARKAIKKEIFVTPEAYYRLDGKSGTHLRLGFSNQTEAEISAGILELSQLL